MKQYRILIFVLALSVLAVLSGCNNDSEGKGSASSEKGGSSTNYPTKPVKIINPFSAGGSADNTSRILGKHAEKYLGKSFVIENRDGGGGTIGQSAGAEAKNDGYTLTLMTSSLIGNVLYNNVSYAVEDFEPIATIVNDPIYLVAGKDTPYNNMEEFIAFAKDNPSKVKVGVNGTQTNPAIANKQVADVADIEVSTIPFDGESAALVAVAGGHVDVMYGGYSGFESQLSSGNVKVLAILADERDGNLKDVATAKESGVDVVSTSWRGIGAPKGTDPEILNILAEVFEETINDSNYQEDMKKVGIDINYKDSEQFKELIEETIILYENYGK